jgi:4'-phosphopantetheinyl transferase EntD
MTIHALTREAVEQLFSCRVKAAVAVAEEGLVERAVSSRVLRVAERRTARQCARQALRELGAIGELSEGSSGPVWPSGVVGSISHKSGSCVAVVAQEADAQAIGVDVERATPPLTSATKRLVLGSDNESPRPRKAHCGYQADWMRVIFSAKEATYKAWYPLGKEFLEPTEINLTFDETRPIFEASVGRASQYRFEGSYTVVDQLIASACWIFDKEALNYRKLYRQGE